MIPVGYNVAARFALGLATLASLAACSSKPVPLRLEKYCVSDSGLSKYWIALRTSEQAGTIRYRYMGQDVRYVVKALNVAGRRIEGRADFQASSTGETRGSPIAFSYDNATDTLTDGKVSATCQNSQGSAQR